MCFGFPHSPHSKHMRALLVLLFSLCLGAALLTLPDSCKCTTQWRLDASWPGGKAYRCVSTVCDTGCPSSPQGPIAGSGGPTDPFVMMCYCGDHWTNDICICNGYVFWYFEPVEIMEGKCDRAACAGGKTCRPSAVTQFWQDVCGCL